MGNSTSLCTDLFETLLLWGFSRHQYYWSDFFMPGLYLCLSLSISLTFRDAWKSFLFSVLLVWCLHFCKRIEGWLWKLILPTFLWVVNSQGYNFGIDLIYLLIKLPSKTFWNFFLLPLCCINATPGFNPLTVRYFIFQDTFIPHWFFPFWEQTSDRFWITLVIKVTNCSYIILLFPSLLLFFCGVIARFHILLFFLY